MSIHPERPVALRWHQRAIALFLLGSAAGCGGAAATAYATGYEVTAEVCAETETAIAGEVASESLTPDEGEAALGCIRAVCDRALGELEERASE